MIWRGAALTSPELVAIAERDLDWKKSTTYTILKRLCDKGVFKNETADGTRELVRPLLETQDPEPNTAETITHNLDIIASSFTLARLGTCESRTIPTHREYLFLRRRIMNAICFIMEYGIFWLQYATKLNIQNESKASLSDLRLQALSDSNIRQYLNDISDYHSILVRNHKDPDLPIHKLLFLLDIGLDTDVVEIQTAIEKIMENKDDNGVYKSLTNIPKHFGGNGEDTFGWCLCDAPLLLFALLKAGIDYEKHIKQGVDYLAQFHEDYGFPCTVSKEFGKFRGPGRKDDPCPYASLIMLKLLSAIPEYRESEIAINTAMNLLSLWENSLERHPYMFYMGTDFRKLKAPAMWYDIVSVVDVLSHFEAVKSDPRFVEMLTTIKTKQDSNGLFTPEAVFQKFKGWDFGQKKIPSPYLTYLCCRIFQRVPV